MYPFLKWLFFILPPVEWRITENGIQSFTWKFSRRANPLQALRKFACRYCVFRHQPQLSEKRIYCSFNWWKGINRWHRGLKGLFILFISFNYKRLLLYFRQGQVCLKNSYLNNVYAVYTNIKGSYNYKWKPGYYGDEWICIGRHRTRDKPENMA